MEFLCCCKTTFEEYLSSGQQFNKIKPACLAFPWEQLNPSPCPAPSGAYCYDGSAIIDKLTFGSEAEFRKEFRLFLRSLQHSTELSPKIKRGRSNNETHNVSVDAKKSNCFCFMAHGGCVFTLGALVWAFCPEPTDPLRDTGTYGYDTWLPPSPVNTGVRFVCQGSAGRQGWPRAEWERTAAAEVAQWPFPRPGGPSSGLARSSSLSHALC
jgi:hypothetical protein